MKPARNLPRVTMSRPNGSPIALAPEKASEFQGTVPVPRTLLQLVLLGIALVFAWLHFGASGPSRSVASGPDPFAGKSVPDAPAAPVRLVSDKARLLHAQVARGDLNGAADTFAGVLASSKMEAWHFYPMGEFMNEVTGAGDDAYLRNLNRWVTTDPTSDVPLILRARYYHDMSWRVRGTRYVDKTAPEKTRAYYELRQKAIADINTAIAFNDRDPYSFYLLLTAEGTEAAFRRGIAKYPTYYPLHVFWLSRLEPKWGGSVDAMYAFVREFADAAPAGSPMKLLYLDLYDDLLGIADSSCVTYTGNDAKRCVAAASGQLISKPLEDNVQRAAALYSKTNPYQYSEEMLSRLKWLVNENGHEVRAAAVLQAVADAMNGSTALIPAKGLSTNFVLDQAAGSVWYHAGRYDNAETLYLRALDDLRSFDFPDEERRATAIGATYDSLASIYMAAGQFEKVIAARNMTERYVGVAGGPRAAIKCEALFDLNRYQDAVDACTKLLDVQPNFAALRFRGKAYRALGMPDFALADLTAVAASDDRFNASAALDLSLIYGDMAAYDKIIQVFSTYSSVFDPDEETRRTVAVAYNNRCYAYLKLRQLKRALEDCDKSLQFDTIPDALQKKHEILAVLESN
jgi:tetratricopeptide (TPR) repeat protein